jgi:HTH-type transcriptional regulator/antitoxin HigA
MRALRKYTYDPDYAVAPGNLVQEYVDLWSMTQKDFATRLELSVESLNRILGGTQPVTRRTAEKLELVTRIAADTWMAMEERFQERHQKADRARQAEADAAWLKTMPLTQLIRLHAVKKCTDKTEQLREVLKFFQVGGVTAWSDVWTAPAVAARSSKCFESNPMATACWIQLGINAAQSVECEQYSRRVFAAAVRRIRTLTVRTPKEFVPELKRLCQGAGVALVFVPEIQGVHWNGATKWLSPSKAVIVMNNRGRFEDRFWFSFFHEAAHVLRDSKKELFIGDDGATDAREVKADEFAAEVLIPRKWDSMVKAVTSRRQVIEIASRLAVSPGIVAGRYEHLKKDYKTYSSLKRLFSIEDYVQ